MNPSRYYTVTMADLYAKQGYLRKAAQIYSHLMEQEPHREDLRLALEKIEREIETQAVPSRKELGLLLREWENLINKRKELKRK
jgi:hypothetical protein